MVSLKYGKKAILLVEDFSVIRFSVRRLLEAEGYEVAEATSGEEALVKAKGSLDPFDLLIVDIHLPGIDGLTAIRKIKEMPGYRYIPVMVLTADAKASTVEEAVKSGAVEYLCKPFTSEQLLQRVDRLIGPGEKDSPSETLKKLLRKEINRARRGGAKFTLILAHRKAGGRDMAEIGRRLRRRLREIDEVVVLSNDLVALVLPLTDAAGSETVAKKFGEWIQDGGWCFGRAAYPEDGSGEEELLRRARELIQEQKLQLAAGSGRTAPEATAPEHLGQPKRPPGEAVQGEDRGEAEPGKGDEP